MIDLLVGAANGKKVKDMSKERYVSYSTTIQSLAEAKKRLGAKSLAQAVIRAQAFGYISQPTGPDLFVFANTA